MGWPLFPYTQYNKKNRKVASILPDQTMPSPKLGCSGQQTDVTFVQTAWNHWWWLWSPCDQWILCVARSPSLTFCNRRMVPCCNLQFSFFFFFLSFVVTASVLYCIFRKEDMQRQAMWTNVKAVSLCGAAYSFKCQFGPLLVNFCIRQSFLPVFLCVDLLILSLLIKHKITRCFI